MDDGESRICQTNDCNLKANLQCPTCVKLGIQDSYFCSQECFKRSWKTHKLIHKLIEEQTAAKYKADVFEPWPYYTFTGKLRPFPEGPKRKIPENIPRPSYAKLPNGVPEEEQKSKLSSQIKILNDEEIEAMKVSCKLGREVLDEAAAIIGVGLTTDEVDRVVHEACIERECYPSPLNYYQFPRSCCTSVNEVICHGIPDLRPLEDGDICNVDISVYHRGFHGDLNETFLIGNVSETAKKLTKVAWECLQKGIETVHPGERYREVGNVIQKHAQSNSYSVVKSYCGHGIHQLFHTTPNVPHYAKNKAIGIMKPGHCFTIEPMISQGTWKDKCWPDKWTAVTVDGLLSAQFEETLLVTDNGVDILTRRKTNNGQPYFMD